MHGEHETKRYAPGPEPIFPAATQIAPAGYRLPRQGTLGVLDQWCTTIASRKAVAGQAAPHRSGESASRLSGPVAPALAGT